MATEVKEEGDKLSDASLRSSSPLEMVLTKREQGDLTHVACAVDESPDREKRFEGIKMV